MAINYIDDNGFDIPETRQQELDLILAELDEAHTALLNCEMIEKEATCKFNFDQQLGRLSEFLEAIIVERQ